MIKLNNSNIKKIIISLVSAAVFTTAALFGVFYSLNNMLADWLYHSPSAQSGNIIVVGIDDRAIAQLGPYQTWSRDVIANAINKINENQEFRPAVIGIDALYIGQTNQKSDLALAKAAGKYNNVVVACVANFGSELVVGDTGNFFMDNYSIMSFEEPYELLRQSATLGHINAMYDKDGVLRHGILKLNLPDGRAMPSFSYSIYQKYAEKMGLDKDLSIPTDALNRFYVDYTALPGGYYDNISVADIINGDFPKEQFKDSIILIGPYAAGLSDYVTTPIDRAKLMYGVEYQANIINQMISKDFKTEVSNILQATLMFIICFLCLYFFIGQKVLPSITVWLLTVILSTLFCKFAYEKGFVMHPLWFSLSVTLFFIAAMAYNYIKAAVEKHEISNTFKRYVAPEIVDELLKEGKSALELGGKMCDIAVLFVDIRGFTTMSEMLTPEEIVSILNKYLTLTTECIIKNHGTLDKFVGDCTMAIWNAPIKQEDYVMNACKAALDMVEGSKKLSEELMEKFGRTVSFGIGVHCGPAVIGNIGAKMRMDFTAIGDTVNTSARLEANAPAGKIYISEDVVNRIGKRIDATVLSEGITLKGKSQKLEIYTLNGLK